MNRIGFKEVLEKYKGHQGSLQIVEEVKPENSVFHVIFIDYYFTGSKKDKSRLNLTNTFDTLNTARLYFDKKIATIK